MASLNAAPAGITPEIMAYFQQLLASEVDKAREQARAEAASTEATAAARKPTEQERSVAKLLLQTMKGFTGKDRRPHVLHTFLQNFDRYVSLMRLEGKERGIAFSGMLTEDAAIWYQSLNRPYEWEEFRQEFLYRFRDPQAEENARVRLHKLRQTGSAKKYTEEFKRLAACISDLTESDKLQTYKHGLKPELRRDLTVMKVRDFDTAIREAEELDEIMFQEKLRASEDRPRRALEEHPPRREKVAKVQEKLRDRRGTGYASQDASKRKEQEELRKKGACFYCKQLGHIAVACPSKPKN